MQELQYFKPHEFDDFYNMNILFLHRLDLVRTMLGLPINVNYDYATKGHSPTSYHYKGRAVDGTITSPESYLNQMKKLYKAIIESGLDNFGLGAYPYQRRQGFHFDDRPEKLLWVCVTDRPLEHSEPYKYFTAYNSWIKCLEKEIKKAV